MAIIVDMPRLSDTMEEGTIANWLKKVGDDVKAGEGLAEIETDKAVMVFESFDKGTVRALLLEVGTTVPLGTPMAILGKRDEDISAVLAEAKAKLAAATAPPAPAPSAPAPEAPAASVGPAPIVAKPAEVAAPAEPADAKPALVEAPKQPATATGLTRDLSAPVDADGRRIPASPLARRLAQERNLDLGSVAGTGPGGRIVMRDLEGLTPARKLSQRLAKRREDEVVRASQMRKTIAKRLVASVQEAPHFYLTIEVDAGRLVALRTDVNAALELRGEKRKVSYNDLVMRACVIALEKHPKVNAAWEGQTIRYFGGVHLGFAVALPEGLITPVIRDADTLDIFALSDAAKTLAARARDQQLESADYSGNSFCVSNLGMFGIDHFTAVINPPAACILAVGALVDAPVVRQGAVVAGHRLTLTLSCDHRAVDGALGAAFLADLRKLLEHPTALIL
jgi:pyruvate dehydrogenase E2 component (dihydrolipoamide acetyltransferase)